MKRILAHNECDAQKRRDAFGERYNAYIGRGYELDEIKKTVNEKLDLKFLRYYHGESAKFKNEPNPIVSFNDGRIQFTEQGLRAALKKKGADPELLKMDTAEIPFEDDVYNNSLYFKRKDVMTQICTITYDCIQMEIKRTYVKGSPFSHYTIIPAKEIPWRATSGNIHTLELTEQEFYFLDLTTLLMDLALEYRLRQEEIAYHAKQMRIHTMETALLDEEQIPLDPIDDATIESSIAECSSKGLDSGNTFKAIVQPWMDAISNYFILMSNKYDDRFSIKNFEIERISEFVPLYNTRVRGFWWYKNTIVSNLRAVLHSTTRQQLCSTAVTEICEGKEVVGEIVITASKFLSNPSREQKIACFRVGDAEMIMDEMIYSSFDLKNTLAIFPNARDRRFRLDINGRIGIHALVGYLKLMPALCKKMDELAARIDKML